MPLNSGKLIVHSVKISFDFDNKRIPTNLSLLALHSFASDNIMSTKTACKLIYWKFNMPNMEFWAERWTSDGWFVFKTKCRRQQHLKPTWRQITCQINNSEYEMSVRKSFKQTIESTFRKFVNSFVCIDFICNEMRNIYVSNDFSKSSNHFLWDAAQR